jgi:hypothetical protein
MTSLAASVADMPETDIPGELAPRGASVFLKDPGAIGSGSATVGKGAVIAMKDGTPKLRKRPYNGIRPV